jgi:hypothetical protein
LPEDLRSSEGLKSFADAGALARSYLDLQTKIAGAPAPPESPDRYEIPVAEGLPVDDEFLQGFRKTAFEAGLSPSQVKVLAEWHNTQSRGLLETRARQTREMLQNTENALHREWGASYQRNLEIARRGFKMAADPDLQNFLETTGLGSDARLMRMFLRIGKAVSEDALAAPEPGPAVPRTTDGGMPMLRFSSME